MRLQKRLNRCYVHRQSITLLLPFMRAISTCRPLTVHICTDGSKQLPLWYPSPPSYSDHGNVSYVAAVPYRCSSGLATSVAEATFADTAYYLYSQRGRNWKIGKPRIAGLRE